MFQERQRLWNESRQSFVKGYRAKFEMVLSQLKESGTITNWRRVEKGSPDFHRGIHYWLYTPNATVPFAVSSTKTERRERLHKHPDVPVVHIRKRSKGKDLEGIRDDANLRQSVLEEIVHYRGLT